jgi:uncharacterized phage-associated protein
VNTFCPQPVDNLFADWSNSKKMTSAGKRFFLPRQIEAVANWFLDRAATDSKPITPMKLQKLIYFAHGWHLGLFAGEPLVDELFEAWEYGPVAPSIYHEFKRYGGAPIEGLATKIDFSSMNIDTPTLEMNDGAIRLLNKIWEVYGVKTALVLSNLTHLAGSPWEQIRRANPSIKNADIPNQLIEADFKARIKK